jgi:hypothetical protein
MKQVEDFIFLVVFNDAKLCEKSFSCMKKKSFTSLDHAWG